MPKYQDSGRSRGYAHVVFSSKAQYEKTLARSGEHMGSRYLTIARAKGVNQASQPPPTTHIPIGSKTVFVKNLPYDCTQEQITDLFSSCGVVTDVRMVYNWALKHFKGFAYVDYRDSGSVKKAMNKITTMQGRKLLIDAVLTHQKKGYKRRNYYDQQDEEENM